MLIIGIIQLLLGIGGIGMGAMMFGDIGIGPMIAGLSAILTGIGFIIVHKATKSGSS